ncbi:hypothetical protein BD309DRAFT_505194 [Dichomitus squalens]|nr:hypothetical protein BD309DRAFT_505194 [Dichomitus squalens]
MRSHQFATAFPTILEDRDRPVKWCQCPDSPLLMPTCRTCIQLHFLPRANSHSAALSVPYTHLQTIYPGSQLLCLRFTTYALCGVDWSSIYGQSDGLSSSYTLLIPLFCRPLPLPSVFVALDARRRPASSTSMNNNSPYLPSPVAWSTTDGGHWRY